MAGGNPAFNEILSTTLRKWLETNFVDNVFKARVLAYTLQKSGNIRKVSGGASIVVPILEGKNGTVMTYSDDEELRILRQKGMTAAEYKWAQAAVSITITGLEEAKNNGESEIINLLQGKITQAEESLTSFFNKCWFNDHATAGNFSIMDNTVAWSGLKDLADSAATVGAWIGGVTPATADEVITGYDTPSSAATPSTAKSGNIGALYPSDQPTSTVDPGRGVRPAGFWNPYKATGQPAPGAAGGLSALRHAYNSVSVGNDQPNLVLTEQAMFEAYEDSLVNNIRYTNTEMADSGFQNLLFKGAPVTYDADCTAKRFYFLNMRYLELVAHSDVWMDSTPFVRPNNRDARTSQILCYGQLVCSNRARLGVVDIT